MAKLTRKEARTRRHMRIRKTVSGTPEVPRLAVCASDRHIHVQVIDDTQGRTLAAVSTLDPAFGAAGRRVTVEIAGAVGRVIAERAKAVNIERVVFDRAGFQYHGKVKAVAESAREAGLRF
jgi:large subunit ribosomal protein L18